MSQARLLCSVKMCLRHYYGHLRHYYGILGTEWVPHLAHLQHRASLLTLLHVPELSLLNEEMILSFPLLPRKNISSTEAFAPWASSLSRAPARQESDIVVLAWPGGAIAEAKGGTHGPKDSPTVLASEEGPGERKMLQ